MRLGRNGSRINAQIQNRKDSRQLPGNGGVDRFASDLGESFCTCPVEEAGKGSKTAAVIGHHAPAAQAVHDGQPVLVGLERFDVERQLVLVERNLLGLLDFERHALGNRAKLGKAIAKQHEHDPFGSPVGSLLPRLQFLEIGGQQHAAGAGGELLQQCATIDMHGFILCYGRGTNRMSKVMSEGHSSCPRCPGRPDGRPPARDRLRLSRCGP